MSRSLPSPNSGRVFLGFVVPYHCSPLVHAEPFQNADDTCSPLCRDLRDSERLKHPIDGADFCLHRVCNVPTPQEYDERSMGNPWFNGLPTTDHEGEHLEPDCQGEHRRWIDRVASIKPDGTSV